MTPAVTRGWAPLRGVLVGREKYVDLPIPELYDLAADAGETRNLIASRPDRAQVLLNALKLFDTAPPGARARRIRRHAGAPAIARLHRRRNCRGP